MLFKKLTHVGEYGLLYLLLVRAFRNASSIGQSKYFLLSFLIVGLTGFGDEYHQAFIPGGGLPHAYDVVIDLLGALTAHIFIWRLLPKMPMRLKSLAKILELD
ncbi:MAG: VanZ family protein [bacterium]|nr:VanZ family protein [bacterium]